MQQQQQQQQQQKKKRIKKKHRPQMEKVLWFNETLITTQNTNTIDAS